MKCAECGKEYKSQSALTAHAKRDHGDDPLAELRAKLGDGAPRPGGAFREDKPLKIAPSGIPSVDYAIGIGGVPRGTLMEVFGPAAAGKTLTALTFSAFAQQQGERVGFMDAERALQPSLAELVPGLDLAKMEYGQPPGDGSGEETLEISRQFIQTGEFAVWTIDSVHACTPRSLLQNEIGKNTMAELAKLMSEACQILEHDISSTDTLGIFINHVKAKPGAVYGRDWSKPGGSAFDYYCSVQLHVTAGESYYNSDKERVGHKVKVRVHKSKVAAPFQRAEYDLFYRHAKVKDRGEVTPGVDIPSCWLSVLKESGAVKNAGGRYVEVQTGEALGYEADVLDLLRDESSELYKLANKIVYNGHAVTQKEEPVAAEEPVEA